MPPRLHTAAAALLIAVLVLWCCSAQQPPLRVLHASNGRRVREQRSSLANASRSLLLEYEWDGPASASAMSTPRDLLQPEGASTAPAVPPITAAKIDGDIILGGVCRFE